MKMQLCKICGHQNKQAVLFRAREMMYGKRDQFDYFQCEQCECLQICDFPANISEYYPSNYYSFSPYKGKQFKGISGYFNRMKYRALVFRQTVFQKMVAGLFAVSKFDFFEGLNINLNTRILEVGCGNGNRLLYPLAELGFKNIVGCDPYISDSINYSNSLTILKNDVFKMADKWDVVIYDHAYEHIENPQENLNKVSELLNPGGVCVLRIPTVPCFAWSHYGTNWVQLDAPRHYFLHSPKSIEILASKAGLKLSNVKYDSTHFQFTGSEKYINDIALVTTRKKGFMAFVRRKKKKLSYEKAAAALNKEGRGDQAIFYLRKD
jgi:SAM-dependent methyltransferase